MEPYARILLGAVLVAGTAACTEGQLEPVAPVLRVTDGSIRLDEDGSASVVLTAAVDRSTEAPTFEIVTQPAHGQLVGDGTGVVDYVPDEHFNGTDAFSWQARIVDDATGDETRSDTATVTIFVRPVNDPPRGEPLQLLTTEDLPVSETLPVTDIENDNLTYTLVAPPEFGDVDLLGNGRFTYTPDHDFVGDDAFLWLAQDVAGAGTGPVRVDVTVQPLNDPPLVQLVGFVTDEDVAFTGQLVATDVDGDDLSWERLTDPAHGTILFNTNLGQFTYTPEPNFFGSDSFDVRASDGLADSVTSTVNITVSSINDPPRITPVSFPIDEDTELSDIVMAFDVEGQPLTYRVSDTPSHGIVFLDDATGAFTYTPDPDFDGDDQFTIIASDPFDDSAPGQMIVMVRPVNDPPDLNNPGLLTTVEDTSVDGSVAGTDPEGNAIVYSVFAAPTHGQVTVSPNTGGFLYRPDPDFVGADQFSLVGSDGGAVSTPAVIDVLVTGVNDGPVLETQALSTLAGVPATLQLRASDPEGDPLFFFIEAAPQQGMASVDANTGLLTYAPDPGFSGNDVLTYSVTDTLETAVGVLAIFVEADRDGDAIIDELDNCPEVNNPDQGDIGGNGVGDVCDCYEDAFTDTLDPDFWAASNLVTLQTDNTVSQTHAARLNGDGAFLETVALPGCASFRFEARIASGPPAPDVTDALVLSVRQDGGPWTVIGEVFGTGLDETYALVEGQTSAAGLDLSGSLVAFRIEVVSDGSNDLFFVDDVRFECDEDSDFLVDCIEATLDGYDLTEPDADGDGLLDRGEQRAGTDPNQPDTDFDGIVDPDDNCPTLANPTQTDQDGNGIGDVCERFGFFDDFESGLVLDPANWSSLIGDAAVEAPGAMYARGANALMLDGPASGTAGVVESESFDFSLCTDAVIAFEYVNRDADSGDDLWIDYWDGTGWVRAGTILGSIAKNQWFYDSFAVSDPNGLPSDFALKLENESISWTDRFYIDNLVFDCDSDRDLLGNIAERDLFGTNPFNPDTDGDGVPDGTEVANGTDPLTP